MEERYHATTQNRFYPDMSNVNTNITVEAKLISPPTNISAFQRNYIPNMTIKTTGAYENICIYYITIVLNLLHFSVPKNIGS